MALSTFTWSIDGITRTALVSKPTGTNLPILFAFHGHGGTAQGFANNKQFELLWPNAIVVYPQGVNTCNGAGGACDQTGWQHSVGEVNTNTLKTDMDLKLYDQMLNTFAGSFSPTSVYLHGWSNGGEFVYDVLWVARGGTITAICNAAALLNTTTSKATKPVMHIAGTADGTVPFAQQQSKFSTILTLDKCNTTGQIWVTGTGGLSATKYLSAIDDDCVFLQYTGDHPYPDDTVPPLIVQFFQELAASATTILSQVEMTPLGGQAYDQFYWFNTSNASLTYAGGTFTTTGSYRFDLSAYSVLGTPTVALYLDGVLQGNISVTSTSIALYSLFLNNVNAGTHSIKIQLSNFNSGANHVRVGLLYFTQTSSTTPPVYPQISPIPLVPGQILTKEHFGSGVLRGFSLGSNGYNQTDANGGNIQAMQDMVGTGANIARCFVEIYRPSSSCEGGTSTANTYQFKTGELDKLARTISRGASLGYYVVPCIFLDPCYNTDFWGNTLRKNSIISLWQQLATLYNGNSTVAGYDLINEPRQNFNYAEVIRFQSDIIKAIRAIDPTHVCMVECVDNDMFAMMLPLDYQNIVYSPHGYSTLLITHQGVAGESSANVRNIYPHTTNTANLNAPWGITQLSKQHDNVRIMTHRFHVPVFIGEFSCVNWSPASAGTTWGWTSTEWTNDNISLLETEEWSWVYHAWRGDYPGWESEIPSSYYNSFTFSNATPQSLPSYGTWVSNRTSSAPTITMLRGWFAKNTTSSSPMATFYISSSTGSDSNPGTQLLPWASLKTYSAGNTYLLKCGDTFYMRIPSISTTPSTPVTISSYSTGAKPVISQYTKIKSTAWVPDSVLHVYKVDLSNSGNYTQYTPTAGDRGNVGFIKVDGVIWGAKKSTKAQLTSQWDYYSDGTSTLYLYTTTPPSGNVIECNTATIGITMSNNLTLSNVKVTGSGATLIKGISKVNVSILNCDVTEGGGAYLGTGTTRFGAGISFDEGATNCLIDGNNISLEYEAGFTMQSHGTSPINFTDMTFTNNTVTQCESGFNPSSDNSQVPTAIGFVRCTVANNTFDHSGNSWSHVWRPVDNQGTALYQERWDTTTNDLTFENNTIINPKNGVYYLGGKYTDPRFLIQNNNICIDANTLLRKNFGTTTTYTYKLADHVAFTADLGYDTGTTWSSYSGGICTPLNPLPPENTYGTWGNGLFTTSNNWNALLPYIDGFNFRLAWSDIENTPGVFNWTYFDAQLRHALDASINVGFMIYTGTSAPIPNNQGNTTAGQNATWLASSPYSVHTFTNSSGTWPYYLDTNYQTRWYNMLDNVADHIASSAYSDADRAKILFWMSAEGSTGDAVPYKGTVSTSPFDFTISTVPGGQWDVFKRAAWTHMNGKIKGNAKTAAIRLLMNPGDDGDGFQWILDNVSDGWMKAGTFTHSYSIPGELQYSARLESLRNSPTRNNRIRGEFEDTDSNVWWQTAYRQNYMAMVTQCLHANIDILNISSATAQTNTLISDPYALTFFSKYAGIRTALSSNTAFIYFRDEIDIFDTTRFPENVYGTLITLNTTDYNTKLNAILTNATFPAAVKDDKITSLKLTLNNTNDAYFYINPTRITNIQADFPSAGYSLILKDTQRDAYNNDYSANSIANNYYRFITQYSPDTTSVGSWRTANTTTDFFGRYGRKPTPEIFCTIDPDLDSGFANNVTFTVHYLDNGTGVWGLTAGTCKGAAEIAVVKNTNTNTVKSIDITISQFSFGGLLTHSSDFSIKSISGTAPVIYMVEFINNSKVPG